jgi:hypothetical protein
MKMMRKMAFLNIGAILRGEVRSAQFFSAVPHMVTENENTVYDECALETITSRIKSAFQARFAPLEAVDLMPSADSRGDGMSDLNVVTRPGSALHVFFYGESWTAKYARKSLPVLVRWVEEERARPSALIQEHTYKELATELGNAKNAHPLQHALGAVGVALLELQKQNPNTFGVKIPPIEMLVWTRGAGRPGDSAFSFVGIKKKDLKNIPESALRSLAGQVRREILAYPHWRKILKALKLQPMTISLPEANTVISDPGFGGRGGGESPDHLRLKHYIAEKYALIGLKGKHLARLEERLLSGDEIDVFLEHVSERRLVGVEVKSRLSSDADLIRGVFQCVKYQAVLGASEDYETARASAWIPRTVEVLLATERALPTPIANLAQRLGVIHVVVKVPVTYKFTIPTCH